MFFVMTSEIGNKQIYDGNWPGWVDMKIHGPASRWLRSLIRLQLDQIADLGLIRSILDVGCGEGTTTRCLAQWLPQAEVVGIDFSKSAIQCAQSQYRSPNLRFIHDENSRELEREYDIITAFEVIEHVEDWQKLVRRIAHSAQQFALFSFPTGRMRAFEKAIGHYRNFERGELESFMSECNFELRAGWYAGFPFYSPLYRDLFDLTSAASSSLVTGRYGLGRRLLSQAIYLLFRFLSTKRQLGDQFCGLFARRRTSAQPSASARALDVIET
jgi:SAM-dependent methyltransferase